MLIYLIIILLSGYDRGVHSVKMPKGKKVIREKLSADSGYSSCYVGCRG
jgi:hypothetical protein